VKRFTKQVSIAVTILTLCASALAQQQLPPQPTAAQCQHTADLMSANPSFVALQEDMSPWDELVITIESTRCLEHQSSALSSSQKSMLQKLSYDLDTDVIERMFEFLVRPRLDDNGDEIRK